MACCAYVDTSETQYTPPDHQRRADELEDERCGISSGVSTPISLSSPSRRSTYCTGLASRYAHWTACLNISFRTTITLPMVLGDKPLPSNVLMNSWALARVTSASCIAPKKGSMWLSRLL